MFLAGALVFTLLVSYADVGVSSGRATSSNQARGLDKALKACKKDKPKSRRHDCEKKARRRYPPRPRAKTKTPPALAAPEPRPKAETAAEELARARTHHLNTATGGAVEFGKTLFASNCQSCHGPHGEGTATVPSLRNDPRAETNLAVIEELISPPPGEMPSYHQKLGFLEKEAVADFVTVEITQTEELIP
jgi:mono/diheme cytochrome c family protein